MIKASIGKLNVNFDPIEMAKNLQKLITQLERFLTSLNAYSASPNG